MTCLPVIHIELGPFDNHVKWECCYEGTCSGNHDPISRKSSQDERISTHKTYLAKIRDRWWLGQFSKQHYGWNFNDWGTSGIALKSIEDLYEVNLAPLDEKDDPLLGIPLS